MTLDSDKLFFYLQVGHIAKAFLTLTFIFVKISKWLNSYIEDAICFFFFFEEIRYVSLLTRTFMKQ